MSELFHVAIDLGAESARVVLGQLKAERLELQEAYRFATGTYHRGSGIFWKLRQLEEQIIGAIQDLSRRGFTLSSISVDSWGIDYVLIDAEGRMLDEPRCYRDPRNWESRNRLLKRIGPERLYAETGVPPDAINTVFQLEAEAKENPALLAKADRLLFIADYLNFRFSGVDVAEVSLASTSQLFNPRSGVWSPEVIRALRLKSSLLPQIVRDATVLGPTVEEVHANGGLSSSQIVAGCSHDTAAAIAAVPLEGNDSWAYLSSGTWSILGAEMAAPLLTSQSLAGGFTHEMGFNGSLLLSRNIVGLWVLQECSRYWQQTGQVFSYDQLVGMAHEACPSPSHINVADPRFLSPGKMPEKILDYCRETHQVEPQRPGQFVRLALESLALFYARTLSQLRAVTGCNYDCLYIIGGGSRNGLLNQLTASAAQINVIAGPMEATAAGNVLIQAKALGRIERVDTMRSIVSNSFPIHRYAPAGHFSDQTRERFNGLFRLKQMQST